MANETNKVKGVFDSLKIESEIFEELNKKQPNWWKLFCKDEELYIEIRKDNYINIYYNGGNVAKIVFKKGKFKATIHQKYLGDIKPRGKTQKGKDKFEYDELDLSTIDENKLTLIKTNIRKEYSDQYSDTEKPAEKWLQCKLILKNQNYIDSEFAYNRDEEIPNLRIDLVELENGILSFVELKRIDDGRLLHDEKRNEKDPDIIAQMKSYEKFIFKYEKEIIGYYKKLIELKNDLGLFKQSINFELNKTPKLLIVNTYKVKNTRRENRIEKIKKLLIDNYINYNIVEK